MLDGMRRNLFVRHSERRGDAITRNADYARACAACGPINHFLVMLPEKPNLPRAENFALVSGAGLQK